MLTFLKPATIARRADVSRRGVILSLCARYADELLGGVPDVLLPTIRAQLGLNLTQISLLGLALNYVAAVIEPINGLLIDIRQRRWLMAWGAAGIGLAVILMGVAPTFVILLLGFALYGLSSGPLAHTADVVLVESHPDAPDRIFARATLIDTLGALSAPMLVTVAVLAGIEWRVLLVLLGAGSLLYAALILRTRFPAPIKTPGEHHPNLSTALRHNVRSVLTSGPALTWMVFLFLLDILEAPTMFATIWLFDEVSMSQALIGVYKAMELVMGILSLLYLDRWLARAGSRRVLQTATVGLLILLPAWLLIPGVWTRFVLGAPLNFLAAVYWPIGRGQSLAMLPGKAGAVTAVQSLFGLVPLPLLVGMLAEKSSLTTAMLWIGIAALALLLLVIRRLPASIATNDAARPE